MLLKNEVNTGVLMSKPNKGGSSRAPSPPRPNFKQDPPLHLGCARQRPDRALWSCLCVDQLLVCLEKHGS